MLTVTGSIAIILVVIAVQTVISAGLLWAAMKLMRIDGTLVAMIVACVIASIVGIIPFVGPLLGFFVLIFLITKFTSAGGFTAFLMILFSWAVAVGIMNLLILSLD